MRDSDRRLGTDEPANASNPRPLLLLAGLVVGLGGGAAIGGPAGALLLEIARPIGALWLDALTMTVVPLVFGLLVTGVADASRSAAAGPTTIRALIWFAVLLTTACLCAAFLAEGLLRLWPVTAGALDTAVSSPLSAGEPAGEWYQSIIPSNPIKAAADTAMVPLVVFALALGFATSRLKLDDAEALLRPLRSLVAAMLVLVGWVLRVGPIGVAALAYVAASTLGAGVFGTLGQYVAVVSLMCLMVTASAYVWVGLAGRTSPLAFARAAAPVQAVALGTQSSLACLPLLVTAAAALRVPGHMTGIILPLAVSLFRAASAAANVTVAVYLAHAGGLTPDLQMLVLAALVAVPVSLGAVGLPAQISFFATIAPVCIAIGAPITALPLLLAIEAVPDLFRTLGNVTNDLAVVRIVGRGRSQPAPPVAD